MAKKERKLLAHFIDSSMGSNTPAYTRIGKDLEEYNDELNPDIEQGRNILGDSTVKHNGYEVSGEVDPFYADEDDPLYPVLEEIANERKTGAACETTKVDVLFNESLEVIHAYREKVVIVPKSIGGDTSGYQIPFTVYSAGERVAGTWNNTTKTFTEGTSSSSSTG